MKQLLEIIYDGGCPFCSSYVQLVRIRENFDVSLINAREQPDLINEFRAKGYDLNDGMIARVGERLHYGAEALTIISLFSSRSGLWNGALAFLFANQRAAAILYPLLRCGRNLTLIALGRSHLLG